VTGVAAPDGDDGASAICSRAECRRRAQWNVNWRNPRIHDISRVKVWRACDEHRDYLAHYLETRDFPVVVTAAGVTVDAVGTA